MTTVKIYTITVTKAWDIRNTGKFASLEPWSGDSMDDKGWDDGGELYELPNGYTVGKDQQDRTALFSDDGYLCDLGVKGDEVYLYPAYGGYGRKLNRVESSL